MYNEIVEQKFKALTQLVQMKLLSRVNSKLNIGKRKLGKIYFEGS